MQKRGNISILVIFVLLASSLLGILSMNFVQQMMKQSAVVNSYYKTYYLSKAGIELGLTQIHHRGIGFNYTVHTGDAIVRENFFSGQNFTLSMNISGTASLLSQKFRQGSGCTIPYMLDKGESLIIPFFKDKYTGPVLGSLNSKIEYQNLADVFSNDKINFIQGTQGNLIFGLLILSGQELYENGIYFQPGNMKQGLSSFRKIFENYYLPLDSTIANSNFPYSLYLLISNPETEIQSFCLDIGTSLLPTDTFFIQSQALYSNQQVALDASYAQPIPSFLFNTYSNYSQ